MNSIKLLHNNLRSCLPIVLTSLLLFLYTTAPINAHSANNNRAIHVDLNAGGDIQKERNPLTRQPGDSPAYNLVQWGCAFEGSKKYLVAVDNSTNSLDMYAYDPTVTPSLSYKQTLTFNGTINDVAVYNQDDSHIYLAIATPNNIQIQLWNGTVQPSGSFIALGSFATTSTVNTLAWWVDATNPLYSAYIATADRQNKVNIYGLSQSTYTFNPINSAAVGSSPLTSLLWYVQTDVMNNITLLDLIGGSTNVANEYTININPTTKSIGAITPNPIPYPMGSLSTCNTFLAIGDLGATPGCAGVTLYDVDSATGSITNMESVISDPDINATNIYYLAKCCSGDPEYLLAGIGDATNYTLYLLDPANLNEIVTSTALGSFVNSVAWCCNGTNSYLAVTYNSQANQAGEIYQIDFQPTETVFVDLGAIKMY